MRSRARPDGESRRRPSAGACEVPAGGLSGSSRRSTLPGSPSAPARRLPGPQPLGILAEGPLSDVSAAYGPGISRPAAG